ncbi:HalOD1 output domain-containing protein [Halobium palmae]|uniref:HalOD1 output domain-containing protein n=1 Tax=Halobium palmae TaxID=1776492 RepID=A0ABD5RWC5_9EURY
MTDDTANTKDVGHVGGRRNRSRIDPVTDSVSEHVVTTAGSIRGTGSSEMPVLANFIDPIALDELFQLPSNAPRERADGYVRFAYGECLVTVESDGCVRVDPAAGGRHTPVLDTTAKQQNGSFTEETFRDRLSELLRLAELNGLEIDGGYDYPPDTERTRWGVEIYPIERRDD